VSEIIRGFLKKQQFRQAAQALETFAGRFPNNPDFFTLLWNEQSVAYPQVQTDYFNFKNYINI
jgi:hypothetical protein